MEYVDRWNNLNLYEDENLQQFWLEVFRNDDICKLDYAAIKCRRNEEVAVVHQTAADVGLLSSMCKFPFSWLFLSAIEDQFATSGLCKIQLIYREQLIVKLNILLYILLVHSFATCVEKMMTHYVGEFLYRYSTVDAARLELDKLYLKDFVAIVLKPASETESKVGPVYTNNTHKAVSHNKGYCLYYFHIKFKVAMCQLIYHLSWR